MVNWVALPPCEYYIDLYIIVHQCVNQNFCCYSKCLICISICQNNCEKKSLKRFVDSYAYAGWCNALANFILMLFRIVLGWLNPVSLWFRIFARNPIWKNEHFIEKKLSYLKKGHNLVYFVTLFKEQQISLLVFATTTYMLLLLGMSVYNYTLNISAL